MTTTENFSKQDMKQMISNLKKTIVAKKGDMYKKEIAHKEKMRNEQRELDTYKRRLKEMQTLIKTK